MPDRDAPDAPAPRGGGSSSQLEIMTMDAAQDVLVDWTQRALLYSQTNPRNPLRKGAIEGGRTSVEEAPSGNRACKAIVRHFKYTSDTRFAICIPAFN